MATAIYWLVALALVFVLCAVFSGIYTYRAEGAHAFPLYFKATALTYSIALVCCCPVFHLMQPAITTFWSVLVLCATH